LIWWEFIGLFRLKVALVAENLALRQQINVLRRTVPKRPHFGSIDRLILVGLFGWLSTARDALAIVQLSLSFQIEGEAWVFRAWSMKAAGSSPSMIASVAIN
jgi:hypothetical protein